MSGTVLGKSCLVLGVEFGMWNARAAPGAASRDRDGASKGPLPRGIQFPGGIKAGPQQELSSLSCHSSWNCSQGDAGAEESGSIALPSLPKAGTHQDSPWHILPGKPLLQQLCTFVMGQQSSGSSLAFRMPSTDLIAREQGFSRTLTHQREKFQPWPKDLSWGLRIWKLFTPQWVIQTWLAQALVDLPQWKHCSDSKDLFRKWH